MQFVYVFVTTSLLKNAKNFFIKGSPFGCFRLFSEFFLKNTILFL